MSAVTALTAGSNAGSDVAALFESTYGRKPTGVWSSPGRVNLIGEHTDYNNGLVLPFAIDARARVAAALTEDGVVQVVSAQQDTSLHRFRIDELAPGHVSATGWSAYLFGAIWALIQDGRQIPGVLLVLDSNVPSGAGLSSSAAIECATTLAVSELLGLGLASEEIAKLSQRDENDFVGVPCGLMDQMASAACTGGHVLYFDVGKNTIQQVPFDPAAEELCVLVIDTRVKHALTDGEYANRRAACEQAAGELGISSLRELTPDDLPRLDNDLSSQLLARRVRHIITENERVEQTVALLRAGQIGGVGPLLLASHESLRDDYEVSDPALDLAVEVAVSAGALGARMTGGGFGGSAIAVVPVALAEQVADAVRTAFAVGDRTAPVIRVVTPSAGAHRDTD